MKHIIYNCLIQRLPSYRKKHTIRVLVPDWLAGGSHSERRVYKRGRSTLHIHHLQYTRVGESKIHRYCRRRGCAKHMDPKLMQSNLSSSNTGKYCPHMEYTSHPSFSVYTGRREQDSPVLWEERLCKAYGSQAYAKQPLLLQYR